MDPHEQIPDTMVASATPMMLEGSKPRAAAIRRARQTPDTVGEAGPALDPPHPPAPGAAHLIR